MNRLLTIKEVEDALGISHAMAYQLLNSGELGSVTIGRLRRVPEAELDAYINRRIQESAEET